MLLYAHARSTIDYWIIVVNDKRFSPHFQPNIVSEKRIQGKKKPGQFPAGLNPVQIYSAVGATFQGHAGQNNRQNQPQNCE